MYIVEKYMIWILKKSVSYKNAVENIYIQAAWNIFWGSSHLSSLYEHSCLHPPLL